MPVVIKASTKAIEEAKTSGDMENAPEGYHVFKLTKVEVGKSKSNNPQMVCHWTLVGLTRNGNKPDKKYWPLRDYVQLEGEETEWKRAEFLLAVGVTKGGRAGTRLEIDPGRPGTVIGKLAIGRVKNEQYNGEDRPKLAKILPYTAPSGEAEFPGDEDEGDLPDEPEAYEPTEEIVEETVVEEETVEDGAFVPWERDALKAAGKDTVKEVAASFKVEIVKGMTMNDVLDAIMEAQDAYLESMNGAQEDGAEGSEIDDGDEPF
jgi:hypothetical protein